MIFFLLSVFNYHTVLAHRIPTVTDMMTTQGLQFRFEVITNPQQVIISVKNFWFFSLFFLLQI